ncbi:MAG: aromatic amino acid ammonia-lyase, partial [Bacteroidales bacterium]|nr:aromatic amino acid ammonia-lyase [Bacteroidales bacterium]
MANVHQISKTLIDWQVVRALIEEEKVLELSEESRNKIIRCREYLDERMKHGTDTLYGINTGFGSLYNKVISNDDLGLLQKNLVMSHACGVGEQVPEEITRLMLFLKVQSLSYGNSGVQPATVERLIDFYNHHITPVVYQYGSLGASGDLAPLAHMSLPLIGMGEVLVDGEIVPSQEMLKRFGWEPIELQSKEGLALLNGTQFMSAYGVKLCLRVFKLSKLADIIGALSLDVFDGRIEPFHALVQQIRPHQGQIDTASRIRI